jgi:hypothetical protein
MVYGAAVKEKEKEKEKKTRKRRRRPSRRRYEASNDGKASR